MTWSVENSICELKEAIWAGNDAKHIIGRVLDSLGDAESWGTFDLFGGGVIADAIKYSKLDDAQNLIENLQEQLRRFKTELADVAIDTELNVQVDGFLKFADFFFDNLFTDWAVMDKIHNSQNQVENTRDQILCVMNKLQLMKEEVEEQRHRTQAKLDELVVQVNI